MSSKSKQEKPEDMLLRLFRVAEILVTVDNHDKKQSVATAQNPQTMHFEVS